jgi:serine/threonine protein kinase
VLFELLTGTSPFDGADLPQLVTSILTQEPLSLAILRPDAPPELDLVVRKCLQKDPEKRYRNVAELVQDLEPFVPASSAERIRHIKRVIREVSSIRPPTPMPGSIRIENIQRALLRAAQPSSPAFDSERLPFHKHIETLAEPIPITELLPPSGEPAVAPKRRVGIAWIVAVLMLFAAVITVALWGPGQGGAVSAPVPSQPSAIAPTAPSAITFANTSPVEPAPPATAPASAAASGAPHGPTPARPAPVRGGQSAEGNLPPPPSATAAPVPQPPTERGALGVSPNVTGTSKPADDYSQFGERR